MDILSFCSLLVVLSLSAVAIASAPSSPSELLPRLHSVKEALAFRASAIVVISKPKELNGEAVGRGSAHVSAC